MIHFEVLHDMLDNVKRLNPVDAWISAIDKILRDDIIFLNTQDQLWGDGIDSMGISLRPYTPFTVKLKKLRGQVTDRTTLKDTGEFYNSFKVTVQKDSFTIDADAQKDDDNLYDKYGIDIVGLTESNQQTINIFLKENYINYLRGKLL